MPETPRKLVSAWTIDYHDARRPQEVKVPHAWRQNVPVAFEGPVTYRTSITVADEPSYLVFRGVSYQAKVFLNDTLALTHEGIWDAFSVPLDAYRGHNVQVRVEVVKNGGPSFPVKDVASGFLPFVYHTFGGIHGEVELVTGDPGLEPSPRKTRLAVDGHRLFVDGAPFYVRGLLHWGWYPSIGHTNAPEAIIRHEVREANRLGFNLVKFCLWTPPHRYLEILAEEGMEAWLELPLWDPSPDPGHQEKMARELETIVRQYRHHDNILIWTVGCELSESTSPEYRQYLYRLVKNLTGCPLVKDNSGGAEMYGGDLREFGDFYDFHPYCDPQFYPAVLDSLMPGPRPDQPILLGEFDDIDVHRDLARLASELPYWVSSLPELNEQGVRWQHDTPAIVATNRFAQYPEANGHLALMESSRRKALFIRKMVHEAVRARAPIVGYSITGWRDTPISTAGFFDDWDEPRYRPDELLSWNGEDVLFLIPTRRPPWVHGGNRPGFLDPLNQFVGQVFWKIGLHSEKGMSGGLVWTVIDEKGVVVSRGTAEPCSVEPLRSTEVGQIHWHCDQPGSYSLRVEFGDATNEWPVWIVAKPEWPQAEGWRLHDPRGLTPELNLPGGSGVVSFAELPIHGGPTIAFLVDVGTKPMPFWRESAYEFRDPEFWSRVPFAEQWARLLPVSPDRAIDIEWLEAQLPGGTIEVLMNRVDARTYVETPIMVRVMSGDSVAIVTTLRPQGGLGVEPTSLRANPAGCALLASLLGAI